MTHAPACGAARIQTLRGWLAAITLLSLIAFWSGLVGFWVQDRAVPVKGKAVDIVGPVYPGGRLLVRWNVHRDRACAATRQELIVDVQGVRWLIAAQTYSGPAGPLGDDSFITQTPLPADIPTGAATMRVTLSFVCNPIHRLWPIVSTAPDLPFRIEARPPP